MSNLKTQGIEPENNIKQDRITTNNTELLSPKADVLDQTRLRPHSTSSRPKILNCLIKLKSQGLSEATVRLANCRLMYLDRRVNLDDCEKVKIAISNIQGANSYRDTFVKACGYYVKYNNLSWIKPRFKWERKIPKIPSTEQLTKITSCSSKKYARAKE